MPIYEYACRDCGTQFEYLVLRNTPPAECPSCKKQNLEQLVTMFAASTDSTKAANHSVAARKAQAGYQERQRADHQHLHDHFDKGHHHH